MTSIVDLPPKKTYKGAPPHWVHDEPSKFRNPWDSWRHYPAISRIIPFLTHAIMNPMYPNQEKVDLPAVHQPPSTSCDDQRGKMKSTWFGHACFLVEFPSKPTEPRGARILFDPVFSKRCSAFQSIGPKRYTPAPCKIEDIPDIDAVVISHNHYDHTDAKTLKKLFQRQPKPYVFAPLGNASLLQSLNAPADNIHIMDWWHSKRVEIKIPYNVNVPLELATLSFDITCTPCQHFSGRKLWDDFQALWSSWVVESNVNGSAVEGSHHHRSKSVKVYFAGDTGYRAVRDGEDENAVPVCPAFKEIGDVFGGFDFAMIPIGAYKPRAVMSPIHCAPQDSVRIFKDIRARKALGMHWGTWMLTTEDVDEPPKKLIEECKKVGIPEGDFDVCDIGETRFW